MVIAKAKDTKLTHAYGYTRLVGWNQQFSELAPDLCESFEVANGNREFTFNLRKGIRWSDGEPFTADDFRFYWEDMANNEEMSPSGEMTASAAVAEAAKMATVVVSIAPIMMIYPFLQKHLVKGALLGAVKGLRGSSSPQRAGTASRGGALS